MSNQLCKGCSNNFQSIKSLEFHKLVCIYHQYRIKDAHNIIINNDNIRDVIILYNGINLKLNNKTIKKNKILMNIKIKYSLTSNNLLLILYNNILEQLLEYYNYLDILNLISNILIIPINDIQDIINTFNNCKKNINF